MTFTARFGYDCASAALHASAPKSATVRLMAIPPLGRF
jgi:hypothetical protein